MFGFFFFPTQEPLEKLIRLAPCSLNINSNCIKEETGDLIFIIFLLYKFTLFGGNYEKKEAN